VVAKYFKMRAVHHDQAFNQLRTLQRGRPRNRAAPVMRHDDRALMTAGINQIGDIADQFIEEIVFDPDGRVSPAVAAQVGRDAFKMRRECAQLMAP